MQNNDRLELRRLGYQMFEGKKFWLWLSAAILPILLVAIIVTVPFENEIIKKLAKGILKDGDMIFLINLFFLPVVLTGLGISYRARLILDETGITYQSGIPKNFQFIRLDWQYQWPEILEIEFKKQTFTNPLMTSLAIRTHEKNVSVMPWQWIDPDDPHQKTFANRKLMKLSKAELLEKVNNTPVMNFLKDRNFLIPENKIQERIDLINSNRMAQFLAGLFVLFVIYFIADIYFGLSEYYAPDTPWHVFIVTGLLGVLGVYTLLRKQKLGKNDCLVMATLFGLGIGLISYPVSIRTNIWTDDQGLVTYTYELGKDNKWIPENDKAPVLEFDQRSRYWAQFTAGDTKTFELRHVGMGYTQINMAPIYQEQQNFYIQSQLSDKFVNAL